jgi:hypothetical protein
VLSKRQPRAAPWSLGPCSLTELPVGSRLPATVMIRRTIG